MKTNEELAFMRRENEIALMLLKANIAALSPREREALSKRLTKWLDKPDGPMPE